jgi:hypothetical protein
MEYFKPPSPRHSMSQHNIFYQPWFLLSHLSSSLLLILISIRVLGFYFSFPCSMALYYPSSIIHGNHRRPPAQSSPTKPRTTILPKRLPSLASTSLSYLLYISRERATRDRRPTTYTSTANTLYLQHVLVTLVWTWRRRRRGAEILRRWSEQQRGYYNGYGWSARCSSSCRTEETEPLFTNYVYYKLLHGGSFTCTSTVVCWYKDKRKKSIGTSK